MENLVYMDHVNLRQERENVCIESVRKGTLTQSVRQYANGLINSNGGALYFGIRKSSKKNIVCGISMNRKK